MVRSCKSLRDRAFLDSWSFRGNKIVPSRFMISDAALLCYDWKELELLAAGHPLLFPDAHVGFLDPQGRTKKPWQQEGTYTDSWGAQWRCLEEGMTGTVITYPLKDAPAGMDDYPYPEAQYADGWQQADWKKEVLPRMLDEQQAYGFCTAELRHGFFFLTLSYLLGYEKLIFAMADDETYLKKLISIVESFNLGIISILEKACPAVWFFPEDLGAQSGPLVTPGDFRRYIKPVYKKLLCHAKDQGSLAYLHSDGDIRTLADDLIDCGFDVVNIQDRVNTIDDIKELFCGRAAVDLDIDRQEITVNGSPGDIRDWVREAVGSLQTRGGGLSLIYDLYPGIPVENISAVMDSLEKAYRGEFT